MIRVLDLTGKYKSDSETVVSGNAFYFSNDDLLAFDKIITDDKEMLKLSDKVEIISTTAKPKRKTKKEVE